MSLRKSSSTDAFIVTDLEDAACFGIVRSAPKILQGGAKDLARSLTYTFASFEMKRGGASGGINARPDVRNQAIKDFVEEFKEEVEEGNLSLDPGKGILPGEFDELSDIDSRNGIRFENFDKDPLHLYLAGLGPVICAEHVIGLEGKTVAIEGFGRHSVVMAELLEERGAKIIGLSTLAGTVRDSGGFSAVELRERWESDGDALVHSEVKEEPDPAWKVFQTDADLLFTGSKMGAINHTTAEKLNIEALIPHQPIPYTAKAFAVLQKKGCVVFPDFIPVAGPIFADWADPGTDSSDVVANATEAIKTTLDEVGKNDDGMFLGSCYRAESFLRSWQETPPFGRPLAS
jgi:glutamate dehydrogenase/leucine dehydrogenase